MADLEPVDIACPKLVNWLVDRKQVPATWPAQLAATRALIDAALTDLPDVPEAVALLTGKYIDYYVALEVLKQLKSSSTEGAKRNFFGQYTSQYVTAWTAIVAAYEVRAVLGCQLTAGCCCHPAE